MLLTTFLGALYVARPVIVRAPLLDAFRPLVAHLLLMGFVTQALVAALLGWSAATRRGMASSAARLGWVALLLLDAGLILRLVGEPLLLHQARPPWAAL